MKWWKRFTQIVRIRISAGKTSISSKKYVFDASKYFKYRKWSNKPPGSYLSKWVLGEGAYSGGGLNGRGAYKIMQKSSVQNNKNNDFNKHNISF